MKKLLFYSSVCLLMILFYGCIHQEGNLPKVKTGNVFFTSYSHFVAGGLVEANESGIMKFGVQRTKNPTSMMLIAMR